MRDRFLYDVFLSHNAQDKPRVRRLAERLKQAGLRVWFDEWNVRSGDIIALKVDEGLEQSRVLLLCISPNALASGWVALERSTALATPPMKAAASSRCCWPTANWRTRCGAKSVRISARKRRARRQRVDLCNFHEI